MTTDPICGKSVDLEAATEAGLTCTYGGATFCFCSGHCMEEFAQLPALYVAFGGSDDEQSWPAA